MHPHQGAPGTVRPGGQAGSSAWVLQSLETPGGAPAAEEEVLASPLQDSGNGPLDMAVVISTQRREEGMESKEKRLRNNDNKPAMKTLPGPGQVAHLVGALSHAPRGCEFDTQLGYMTGLLVQFLVRACLGGSRLMFLSLSLLSSLPPSLKSMNVSLI